MGYRRLAETGADLMQSAQIRIRQIGIALPDVVDRFIHPVTLIFRLSLQNTAAVHVTEQLITGSIKKLLVRQIILQSCYLRKRAFSALGRDLIFSLIT